MTQAKTTHENKNKFNTQFVIIWKGRYFGCNFKEREIREITFEEAFGCSLFDWDNNICIASEWSKQQYDLARGKDGCGLTSFFNKNNELRDFELSLIKEYEEKLAKNDTK